MRTSRALKVRPIACSSPRACPAPCSHAGGPRPRAVPQRARGETAPLAPRRPRAPPPPQAPAPLGAAAAPPPPGAGATLRDLCADDKAKVARLIKQVVELGGENQRLRGACRGRQRDQRDGAPAGGDQVRAGAGRAGRAGFPLAGLPWLAAAARLAL
jgi:hypothetical protein